jgi:hypothetical protein
LGADDPQAQAFFHVAKQIVAACGAPGRKAPTFSIED